MKRQGFTLVELSVVLVIVGLLIGGILVAQSMIQTVKAQVMISNLLQYEVAVGNFKTNYKYYPGDSAVFSPEGNQDNKLEYGAAGYNVTCNGIYSNEEYFQAFAQLTESGMLKSSFVPFSPGTDGPYYSCGGTQHNNYGYSSNFNVVAPTLAEDNAIANILPFKNEDSNFGFQLQPNISNVFALEAKLGAGDISSLTQPGLANYYGRGNCYDGLGGAISCNDPTASLALLYYILQPY